MANGTVKFDNILTSVGETIDLLTLTDSIESAGIIAEQNLATAKLELLRSDRSTTTHLGHYSDLLAADNVSIGNTVGYLGEDWEALVNITNATTSVPSDTNTDWFRKHEAVRKFVVSQLAGGIESNVGYIVLGTTVNAFTHLISPTTGKVFERGIVTGTTTGAFDPDTGTATGLSDPLLSVSVSDTNDTVANLTEKYMIVASNYTTVGDEAGFNVIEDANLPDNVTTSTRYVLTNPYGALVPCEVYFQLFLGTAWTTIGQSSADGGSVGYYGALAGYVPSIGVVIQTALGVLASSASVVGLHLSNAAGDVTTAPCRVLIKRF